MSCGKQELRRTPSLLSRFFEWYREKGQRQPYFIYFTDHTPSEEMIELGEGEGVKEEGAEKAGSEWEHPTGRMLTMAGLFDVWRSSPVSLAPVI